MANPMPSRVLTESLWVQVLKVTLLALCAFAYTSVLVDMMGQWVVVGLVALAGLMAPLHARSGLRFVWIIGISAISIGAGLLSSTLMLDVYGLDTAEWTIRSSRMLYYSGLAYGIIFLLRSASLRWRTAQIFEAFIVIGAVVFLFFAHRDFNLHNPRAFADWAYGEGYDIVLLYRLMGLGVGFLSLLLLIGRPHLGKLIYSLIVLILFALVAGSFVSDLHLQTKVEDPLGLKSDDDKEKDADKDADGDGASDKDGDGSGGSGGGEDDKNKDEEGQGESSSSGGQSDMPSGMERPVPVAISVFYDDFEPGDGFFYFRQSVLSAYNGNHLVSSPMDSDVISSFPLSEAQLADESQSKELHTSVATSMFLLQEHTSPPQLAMGQKVFGIDNPDPKLFISAYGVESLGLSIDVTRLIGRHSVPLDWDEAKREHYLKVPDDPRYQALSDIIVRQMDMRFADDDIVKALMIRAWLEQEGYYTLKTRHIDVKDPTASFLFGTLRGYCVHFAHAAVYLFRAQGIAARVAVGYAVDNQLRGTNSAVLIMGNQAHAWPEIYVDGVGWVTFDIYPESGDEAPSPFIDQDLESLFGELARNDKTGGKGLKAKDEAMVIPWRAIWLGIVAFFGAALVFAYLRKIFILLLGTQAHQVHQIYRPLRAALFVWVSFGHKLSRYPTLEAFARDKAGPESATLALVNLGVGAKLGAKLSDEDAKLASKLYVDAKREARAHSSFVRRLWGIINPVIRL